MLCCLTAFRSRPVVLVFNLLICSMFFLSAPAARAQTRVSDRDMIALMRNLREDAKTLQPRFDSALQKSTIRKTSREKDAKKLMATFVRQTDALVKRFKKDRNGADAFTTVMNTAQQIDATVNSVALGSRVNEQWQKVRTEVQHLAAAYNIPSSLGNYAPPVNSAPPSYAPMASAMPASSGKGTTWLQISAFATEPLAGADVAVYDVKGKKLFERKNATNEMGVYPARIDRLPADFRVTVTTEGSRLDDAALRPMGKFTLSADARKFNPDDDVVYVNPVTTLVTRVGDKLPGRDLEAAKARVRKLLVLPPDANLGAAMRQGPYYQSPYFSETEFLRQARKHGGFDRFESDLARQAVSNRSATDSFYSTRAVAAPVVGYVADKLAGGIFSWAIGSGLGWVMGSSGVSTPGATKQDILNLQKSLEGLQDSVLGVSGQLQSLTTQIQEALTTTQYNQIIVPALKLAIQVNGVEQNLTYFVKGCPPLPETGGTRTQFADYCAEKEPLLRSQLREVAINRSFETLAAYLVDNRAVGFDGAIHLYSESLGRSVRFFRAADSTKMENAFDYWEGVLVQSANLKVELMHLNGAQNNPGGVKQLKSFLGDAGAEPPAKGEMRNRLDVAKKLTFPKVPPGTVINTLDRTMWAVDYPAHLKPGDCLRPFPNGGASERPIPIPDGVDWNRYIGWRSPTVTEAQALIYGWTGKDPNEWLIEKTRSEAPASPISPGFANLMAAHKNGCTRSAAVWVANGRDANASFGLDLGSGRIEKTPVGTSFWIFLIRQLTPYGEQYYWYPEQ